jgi:hypothetical protein
MKNKKTRLSWWFAVHSIVHVETNAVWVRTVTVDPFFSSSATRRLCYWENGPGAYVLSDLFHGEDAEREARCRCGDRWGILRLFSFGIWLFSPMRYSRKQRACKRNKIVQLPGDKTPMYQWPNSNTLHGLVLKDRSWQERRQYGKHNISRQHPINAELPVFVL